jgi:hypothetical protein
MAASKAYPPSTAAGNYLPRKVITKNRILLQRLLKQFFNSSLPSVATQIAEALNIKKAENPTSIAESIALDWQVLPEEVEEYLASVTTAGGEASLDDLGQEAKERFGEGMRFRARQIAALRSAELVGMRLVDGQLVQCKLCDIRHNSRHVTGFSGRRGSRW